MTLIFPRVAKCTDKVPREPLKNLPSKAVNFACLKRMRRTGLLFASCFIPLVPNECWMVRRAGCLLHMICPGVREEPTCHWEQTRMDRKWLNVFADSHGYIEFKICPRLSPSISTMNEGRVCEVAPLAEEPLLVSAYWGRGVTYHSGCVHITSHPSSGK